MPGAGDELTVEAMAQGIDSPRLSRERLLTGVPVVERRLHAAGVSSCVLEGGSGPPLVLLHGGIECGGVMWAPVVARLAVKHRLVIPDLPGLGESAPVDRLDAATFATWFNALLELTCDEPPAVIAHSLGGTLAARFAAHHGDRIGRLVIIGGPGVGPYRMPAELRIAAIRFGLHPTERNLERFERLAFLDLDEMRGRDPGWFEAFGAYVRSRARAPHVKRAMRRLVASCTKQVPDSELRRIAPAPELVWGRHDRFVPVALAEHAAVRLDWRLHVIEDAGHVPQLERPDAFLQALDGGRAPNLSGSRA